MPRRRNAANLEEPAVDRQQIEVQGVSRFEAAEIAHHLMCGESASPIP